MQHRHFSEIPSTQIYLREHLEEFKDSDILVSCDLQTNGIGRTNNQWDFYSNSLAMSFSLLPNATPSLTPIEIGILCCLFFKEKFNTKIVLKWPNDLMTNDLKKCGGIICNYINSTQIIAGLGLNLSSPLKNYSYPTSHLMTPPEISTKDLSIELYEFILKNRIHHDLSINFKTHCAHLDQYITLLDEEKTYSGIFRGIANSGEAIIEVDGKLKNFLSGSLLLN